MPLAIYYYVIRACKCANHIEIATKGITKTALFLSVCYPFIAIPYPQSRKNVENNKSQVVYDDLKLNGNKVLWIKKKLKAY